MKKIILIFSMLVFNSACSVSNLKKRDMENYYQASGIEKYFLNEIPEWLNFHETLQCQRNRNFQFFNIPLMQRSYQMSFLDAIQFQASYNFEYLEGKGAEYSLQEKQFLFYKSLDRINNKINFFDRPKFKSVFLVLIDSEFNDEKRVKDLKSFLNSSTFDQGVPVLVSFCYSKKEIESKFFEKNYGILSGEMTTTYLENGDSAKKFYFPFEHIFPDDYKLRVYKSKNFKTVNLFSEKIKEYQY